MWDHQRGVEHDTKDQWLGIYKKDEPNAHFHVSSRKPKHNPTIDEGITDYLPSMDSVSAFGRSAADTATFGGYKYAKAGADYVAKKALKATGLSKQDTTYQRELDQENEKLSKDAVKNPQASAAGNIAGMGAMAVAPEIPGVGAALSGALKGGETVSKIPSYLSLARKAVGLKENLAGAGTSADGGMAAPFSAVGQEIDSRRKKKPIPLGKTMGSYVDEDAPANAVGTGSGVAGLTPNSLPGRPSEIMPMARRGKKFMGVEPYIVSSKVFNQLRESKRRGKHWRTYLEEDDAYHHIRMEAKKSKGPIIVEDERTGALMYVRYGKGGSLQ